MKLTAAERNLSGKHELRHTFTTHQYDVMTNWLLSKRREWERIPTLKEFHEANIRRGFIINSSTEAGMYERYKETGTCRPRNWKDSKGKSPRNPFSGKR